jgi:hypothetical protein
LEITDPDDNPEIPVDDPQPVNLPIESLENPVTTRSGRITGPPTHLQDFIVYEATTNLGTRVPDIDYMSPLACGASSDPDVLYYHEAMAAHDHLQFRR